jgi:hypothetical protein
VVLLAPLSSYGAEAKALSQSLRTILPIEMIEHQKYYRL